MLLPSSSAREKHIPVLLLDLTEPANFMCTVGMTPSSRAKTIGYRLPLPEHFMPAVSHCPPSWEPSEWAQKGSMRQVAEDRPWDSQKKEGMEWAAVARKL